MGTRVYLLDNGWLTIDQLYLTWNQGAGTPVRFPNYAVFIDHPQGKVLIDTGFDKGWFQRAIPSMNPEQSDEQRIVAQLAKIGVLPEQIDIVVNSHLHPEHCAANRYFPGSRFIMSKSELRHAFVPDPWERHAYDRNLVDMAGIKQELLDLQNSEYEVLPGITLFDTPGHSAGHLSAVVHPDNAPAMLFSFDAAYTRRNLKERIVMGLHTDPEAVLRSFDRIQHMARRHGATIFYPHDADEYATYRLAPEYYGE